VPENATATSRPSRTELNCRARGILIVQFPVAGPIRESMTLKELGFSPVGVAGLVAQMEYSFGVTIHEFAQAPEEFAELATFGQLVDLIEGGIARA
jgi:hypothetical protein